MNSHKLDHSHEPDQLRQGLVVLLANSFTDDDL